MSWLAKKNWESGNNVTTAKKEMKYCTKTDFFFNFFLLTTALSERNRSDKRINPFINRDGSIIFGLKDIKIAHQG